VVFPFIFNLQIPHAGQSGGNTTLSFVPDFEATNGSIKKSFDFGPQNKEDQEYQVMYVKETNKDLQAQILPCITNIPRTQGWQAQIQKVHDDAWCVC
jgi:hypothetical protein